MSNHKLSREQAREAYLKLSESDKARAIGGGIKGAAVNIVIEVCAAVEDHMVSEHAKSEREQELVQMTVGSIQKSMVGSLSSIETVLEFMKDEGGNA